jgi:cubilin
LDSAVVSLEADLCLNYTNGSSQCNSFVRITNSTSTELEIEITILTTATPPEQTTITSNNSDSNDSNFDTLINSISERIDDLIDASVESRATAMGVTVLAKKYHKLINSHSNFPQTNYSNNYDASTTIVEPPGKNIQILAVYFDLETDFDYLEIGDYGRFSGSENFAPIISQSNKITLRFKTDGSNVGRGFQISYRSISASNTQNITFIGTNVSAKNNINYIYSHPSYLNTNYSNNYDASTTIIAPIGKQVQISSIGFALENSVSCAHDYLEIGDFGKFCGSQSFKMITTQSNEITLRFRTDGSNVGRGFRISYHSISASNTPNITFIGTNIFAKNNINYIYSHPSYLNTNYSNNYDASTTIIAPSGKNIHILAVYFDLETGFDYLEIGDYGRFSGSENFEPIISQSNIITLRFKTDGSDVGRGFQISYRSVLVPNVTIVGTDDFAYDNVKYIISYPDYSNTNYPHNYDRNTTIGAPTGKQILISSIDFNLESCSSCSCDYLEVGIFGRYCGSQNIGTFLTSINQITLRFKTDSSSASLGFKISYRAVLPTTVTIMGTNVVANDNKKYINSHSGYPNTNYSNNSEQITRIVAQIGKQVQISYVDFALENSISCAYDYLEIGDFGKFCGSQSFKTITTQSNEITLRFRTNGSNVGRGFQISYRSVSASITPNITFIGTNVSAKDSINYIYSHLSYFNTNYPNNYDQSTRIIAPVGKQVQISSIDFALENSASCAYDYLEIGDFGKFCGSQGFKTITTQSNEITLRFRTDGSKVGHGFQISYRSISASNTPNITFIGTNVSAKNNINYIYSHPSYLNTNYSNNYDASTTIIAPIGKQVQISSLAFDLESCSSCSCDYLEIGDLGRYCGSQNIGTFLTSSNEIILRFKTDGSNVRPGFRISYRLY